MNILKALFGGQENTPEDEKEDARAKDFDVLKYDGVRALQTGQLAYAVQCFNHALEINNDLECRDYLSQALIRSNNLPDAYRQLQIMSAAEPDNVAILLRMADVCYMMEDYTQMGETCEKALMLDDKNPQALYYNARACLGRGDEVNAIALLTKAISQRDEYVDAYLLRGETLLRMGALRGAEEDANYLLSRNADQEDVLLLKARILMAKNCADEGISFYDRVIEMNPFCIVAFRERGAARLRQGDKAGAEEDMRMVLEIDPEHGADITGQYSAEGIEEKVRQVYQNSDLLNLFTH